MSVRLLADETKIAIYEEAPGGGDPINPTSLMNRPFLEPLNWINNVLFHSDLNYYRIAAQNLNVNINHATVPGKITNAGNGATDTSDVVRFAGQGISTSHLLISHNLGYVPRFFCIYDNKLVPNGIPVQVPANNQFRIVTAYANETEIRLYDLGWSSTTDLPAISLNYKVIVFHDSNVDEDLPMIDIRPGLAIFGQGKFKAEEPHLRADGLGDIQWPIATSKSTDIKNGGIRSYYPNGGFFDFMNYNGTLPAPTYLITSAGV